MSYIGTLASVYHKPPATFIDTAIPGRRVAVATRAECVLIPSIHPTPFTVTTTAWLVVDLVPAVMVSHHPLLHNNRVSYRHRIHLLVMGELLNHIYQCAGDLLNLDIGPSSTQSHHHPQTRGAPHAINAPSTGLDDLLGLGGGGMDTMVLVIVSSLQYLYFRWVGLLVEWV